MIALPKPAYVMSEPHLSGWRVVLGYETLADAQAAQSAVSAPEAREDAQPVAWRFRNMELRQVGVTLDKYEADRHRERGWEIDPLYTTPPAPEAEKLRAAVEAIRTLVNQSGPVPKGEVRSILAALQQEGR